MVYCTAGFLCLARNGEDMEDREIRNVLDVLDNAGIRYRMVSHDPVYTIEEMERLHLDADAEIAKNLFLRDARGKRHFLVVLCSCKTVALKALRGNSERVPCPLPRKIG